MKALTLLLDGEPMRYEDLVRHADVSRLPFEFDVAKNLPPAFGQALADWCRKRHVHVEELPVG